MTVGGEIAAAAWLLRDTAALQLSLLLGAAFGVVLQRSRFCVFCTWRDWIDRRDGAGLNAILAALAVGILGYTLLYGAWLPDPSGARRPPTAHIGPTSWVVGLAGLVFGAGMAISGSCFSAHLSRLGEGSPIAPFALLGAAVGFWFGFQLWNPLYLGAPSEAPVVWLPHELGYAGALVAALCVLGALFHFIRRHRRSPAPVVVEPWLARAVLVAR